MFDRELKTAIASAKEAGHFLLHKFASESTLTIDTKAINDFVTDVDRESEKMIVSRLTEEFPEYGIMAEETDVTLEHSDAPYWIIDPLDGTTNFIHSYPMFCVCIALYRNNDPLVGVVYDPVRDELFSASSGGGAYVNDTPISVSRRLKMKDSLIGTGFPFRNFPIIDKYYECFSQILRNCRGIRRAGAAGIDLAYVACARLDGFWEHGLQPWDLAAGALLILEAGGRLTDFLGGADYLFGRTCIASNSRIHDELFKIVSATMPHSYPQ